MMGSMIDKELIGHYCSLLLPGIPVVEIKVTSVNEEEVIGEYYDGAPIHIRREAILAYWPDEAKTRTAAKRAEAAKRKRIANRLERV